jgi:hypothetical protein
MKSYSSIRTIVVVLAITVAVSFLLFFDFGRTGSRIIDEILSFGHLFLFGTVGLVTFWTLNKGTWSCRQNNLYFRAWAIASFSGALTECIQALIPYRHFRLGDILTDALGAAVFLAILYSIQKGSIRKSIVLLCSGLLLLMVARAYPIFAVTVDSWNMEKEFPVLSSFESPFEISRWVCKEGSMKRTSLHATDGTSSLRVNLPPGLYPGITLDYMTNDWRGYKRLTFDAFIEGSAPFELSIRINDRRHNEEYTDRFNKSFLLGPGPNSISVGLDEVRTAPRSRKMDMADITVLCIFSYKLKEPRIAYFDNFRLEK